MNGYKKPVLDLVGRTCCNHSLMDALIKAKKSREFKACMFSLTKKERDNDFLMNQVRELGSIEMIPDVDIAKVSFHQ